jgi:TatD-related deoxyribonuclease
MAQPPGLPIVDHHCHLSPDGEGVEAARRFRRAGGTHLFLCTQSYTLSPPTTLEGYRDQFSTTEALASKVRDETGCAVRVVLAPFPVDLVAQVAELGTAAATGLQVEALQEAADRVRRREAVALGEVGWPHFEVESEVSLAAEAVFDRALELAREVPCPLVIHSSDLDPTGYRTIVERGRRHGVPPERLIKHYARSVVTTEERGGMAASYVARRETVRAALGQPGPYFFETDFLDDPRRPGAVLDLETVPRRAAAVAAEGGAALERLHEPFVRSVERCYGFRPELEDARDP